MAFINVKSEAGILYLCPQGRVDTTNAPQVEQEIMAAKAANTYENIIIDADALEYISSAGLRVILRLRKDVPGLKIVNASPEVFDVLEMTGFTEMIPVEKAYRKLSVEGCEVIGQGANGKVYRLDAETIIKVYMNPDSLADIHRERELARRAFVLGIPTAIPYDVVKTEEGYGSVFELLNAKSFAKLVNSDPDHLENYIDLYADLLKKIHSTHVKPDEVADMRAKFCNRVKTLKGHVSDEVYEKLTAHFDAVPEDDRMIHGDFHLKNVMMQNDEILLIDMDTLSHGHPVYELACMHNAYVGFCELDPKHIEEFMGITYEAAGKIWEGTLRRYLGTDDPAVIQPIEEKIELVAYVRLLDRRIRRGANNELEQKEYDAYKKHVLDLLEKVDAIVF